MAGIVHKDESFSSGGGADDQLEPGEDPAASVSLETVYTLAGLISSQYETIQRESASPVETQTVLSHVVQCLEYLEQTVRARDSLAEQNAQLFNELQQARNDSRRMAVNNTTLEQFVEEMEQTESKVREELRTALKELNELRDANSELEFQLEDKELKLAAALEKQRKQQLEIQEVQEDSSLLEVAKRPVKRETILVDEIISRDEEIARLQECVAELESTLQDLGGELIEVQTGRERAKEQNAEMETQIEELNFKLGETEELLRHLQEMGQVHNNATVAERTESTVSVGYRPRTTSSRGKSNNSIELDEPAAVATPRLPPTSPATAAAAGPNAAPESLGSFFPELQDPATEIMRSRFEAYSAAQAEMRRLVNHDEKTLKEQTSIICDTLLRIEVSGSLVDRLSSLLKRSGNYVTAHVISMIQSLITSLDYTTFSDSFPILLRVIIDQGEKMKREQRLQKKANRAQFAKSWSDLRSERATNAHRHLTEIIPESTEEVQPRRSNTIPESLSMEILGENSVTVDVPATKIVSHEKILVDKSVETDGNDIEARRNKQVSQTQSKGTVDKGTQTDTILKRPVKSEVIDEADQRQKQRAEWIRNSKLQAGKEGEKPAKPAPRAESETSLASDEERPAFFKSEMLRVLIERNNLQMEKMQTDAELGQLRARVRELEDELCPAEEEPQQRSGISKMFASLFTRTRKTPGRRTTIIAHDDQPIKRHPWPPSKTPNLPPSTVSGYFNAKPAVDPPEAPTSS